MNKGVKVMKRIISLFMSLMILFTAFPNAVLADGEGDTADTSKPRIKLTSEVNLREVTLTISLEGMENVGELTAIEVVAKLNSDILDENTLECNGFGLFSGIYKGYNNDTYSIVFVDSNGISSEKANTEFAKITFTLKDYSALPYEISLSSYISNKDNVDFDTRNGTLLTNSVTIDETWQPILSFETNGGEAVDSIMQDAGTAVTLPVPKKTGYKFTGWYYDSELTSKCDITAMPEEDKTLYASWTQVPTIIFNTNGGEAVDPIMQDPGTVVTLPVTTRAGYTFGGWYTDSKTTQKADITVMPSEIVYVYLYAKWIPNMCTITFETNCEIETEPLTAPCGTAIELPVPIRAGYTFDGWYSDSELTEKFTQGKMPSDATLYAKWLAQNNINFVTNCDIVLSSMGFAEGEDIRLPIISREGYTFDGWYSDSGLTQKFTQTAMGSSDITLYAKWSINGATGNVTNIIFNHSFEDIENCNTIENGMMYAVMPALANGDSSALYEHRMYQMDNNITLQSCSRNSDSSSFFRIDYESNGDMTNSYLTTSICRFANSERGSKIVFGGFSVPDENSCLVLCFDVKMQDAENRANTWFQIDDMNISRLGLGISNDEWAKVMVVYSSDTGARVYRISDDNNVGELIAKSEQTMLNTISFNYDYEVKTDDYPLGYPLVSLDNMALYTVKKADFSIHNLNEIVKYDGKISEPENLSWDGSTAKWDSVAHASGYNVDLLRNGKVVKRVENITGPSYDFGEFTKDGSAYRFSVVALPDNSSYYHSIKKASELRSESTVKVGEYVQMGSYYGEPIMWRCIDVDENGPILIADKIICVKAFDATGLDFSGSHKIGTNTDETKKGYSCYWGDSNLRCWLNSDKKAGKVVWECGNPPDSKALEYDAYEDEAGFLTNFSATERYALKSVKRTSITESFYDKVALLSSEQTDIFKYNSDILGVNYQPGIITEKVLENSQYLQNNTYWDSNSHEEKNYQVGDKYYCAMLPSSDDYISCVNADGEIGGRYPFYGFGIRPVVTLDTRFALNGDGSADTPYTLIDDISGIISVPKEDISPKIYDVVDVPVSITNNKGFASAAVEIHYDKNKFSLLPLVPISAGNMLLGAKITYSETADGIRILAVNPTNISSDGVLFKLRLVADVNLTNSVSEISIEPIEFYDENLKVIVMDTDNDSFNSVLTVSGDVNGTDGVNSADAVMLAQYLAKYKNTTLTDEQKANSDVYTDGTINIKDMYVLSQYIVNNLSSGGAVSASLMSAENPAVKVKAKYADEDRTMVDVTFLLSDNTGFTGCLFEMSFDNTVLTPISITPGALLAGKNITSNINESGVDLSALSEVTALVNTDDDISGDGELYTVRFKINGGLTDAVNIGFKNSGFTTKVEDVMLDAPESINLISAINNTDEDVPENEVRNLKAVPENGKITLTWDKNDNAFAYVVYIDDVQKETVTGTSYTADGLENGTTYKFTVKTLGSEGLSDGVSVNAAPMSVVMSVSGDDVVIECTGKLENAVLIFAGYTQEGEFVSATVEPVSAQTDVPASIKKPELSSNGNKLKIMLWNGFDNISPLHTYIEE